jgi:hypothetical protein
MKGIDGIYVANVYTPGQAGGDPDPSSVIQTVISYNKVPPDRCADSICAVVTPPQGGDWHLLSTPSGTVCSTQPCHLHLNGPAESSQGRFYSDDDALGLMMATGAIRCVCVVCDV